MQHNKLFGFLFFLSIGFATQSFAQTPANTLKKYIDTGDKTNLQKSIKAGVDISQRFEDGNTLFLYAVERGEVQLANMLLESGADIRATDNTGHNVLWKIAYFGQKSKDANLGIKIFQLALDSGLDINKAVKSVRPAQFIFQNPILADYIAKNKIQVHVNVLSHGKPVFFHLVRKHDLELIKRLEFLKPDYSMRDFYEDSILHEVLQVSGYEDPKNLSDKIHYLVEKGANVNARGSLAVTPLMEAVEEQGYENVVAIVEAGAKLNLRLKRERDGFRNASEIAKFWIDDFERNNYKHKIRNAQKIYRYLIEQEDLQN